MIVIAKTGEADIRKAEVMGARLRISNHLGGAREIAIDMARSKHNRKGKKCNLRSSYFVGRSQSDGFRSDYFKFSDIEIHGESPDDLNPEVESLISASLNCLRQGDGKELEIFLSPRAQ
ncbi:MAG TPA: hypothetical protein VJ302_04670 [Blastocatellia bacterium]|nr:hypothetical protein [Blastocatellia bacterium]